MHRVGSTHVAVPLLLAFALLRGPAALAAEITGRVEHVVDGDTFLLRTNDGQRINVRIAEIDAPESDQPYGNESRRLLEGMIDGKQVNVAVKTTDDYGRTVGRPFAAARDIAAAMVRDGGAWAYRQYLTDRELLRLEADAHRARVGLWGAAAEPIPPWDWRHRETKHRCDIKGNINSDGERIYHVPGQRYYGATQINTAHGERWFCNEAEARTAGWRRSQK